MRNVFLTLVLANLLLLAWQFWVEPASSLPSVDESNGLVLYGVAANLAAGGPPAKQTGGTVAQTANAAVPPSGPCWQIGPMPDAAAAQQAAKRLIMRGIDAVPIARDAQLWLGHWVQIGNFDSVAAAEAARQRLINGGLVDAYLMQDATESLISLGVFRDPGRAERVASAARAMGFEVAIRERYRPGSEQWLLIRPGPGQAPEIADLSLAGDRIMRTERAACEAAEPFLSDPSEPPAPAEPPETL